MGIVSKLAAPRAATAKPKQNKYSGIKASAPRDPFLNVGDYELLVEVLEEGYNPGKGTESAKITVIVLQAEGGEASEVNSRAFITERTAGAGSSAGLSRLKSFIIAASGFASEEDFDAEFGDKQGEFIAACMGASNEFSQDERLVVGRKVACFVTRGNPTPSGDYYRQYEWVPVEQ